MIKDQAGKFRFHLKAADGEIIAASQGYETKESAHKGIESVNPSAPDAQGRRPDRPGARAQLICRDGCQQGKGGAAGSYPDGASLLPWRVRVVSVSMATRGQTDIRGLVTAGRGFGWIASACLASSVDPVQRLLIVESRIDPRAATTVLVWKLIGGGQSSMTASDQHQPASSRAIATLATVGRLRRVRNPTHRPCSRWLPA